MVPYVGCGLRLAFGIVQNLDDAISASASVGK